MPRNAWDTRLSRVRILLTVARLWQQYEGTCVGQGIANADICGYFRFVAHKFNDSEEPQSNKWLQTASQNSQRRFVCLPQVVVYQKVVRKNKCGTHFLKCSILIIITKASARLAESLLWVCWIL